MAAAERRQVIATAARFVETAVKRDHAERAYELVGPNLRNGTTLAHWRDGDIPVVPYPVDAARWKFDYSYTDEIGLQVAVFPEAGETVRPMVFNMSLRAVGAGAKRHWLVDSWSPRGGGGGSAPRPSRTDGSPFRIDLTAAGLRLDEPRRRLAARPGRPDRARAPRSRDAPRRRAGPLPPGPARVRAARVLEARARGRRRRARTAGGERPLLGAVRQQQPRSRRRPRPPLRPRRARGARAAARRSRRRSSVASRQKRSASRASSTSSSARAACRPSRRGARRPCTRKP